MEAEMEPESKQAVARRRKHKVRVVVVEMAFAAVFAVSILLVRHFADPAPSLVMQIGAVGLPVLVLSIWWIYSANRVLKLEEFERSLAINSFAIASAIVFWLGTAWGLGARFVGIPALPIVFIAPVATVIWQSVWVVMSARYT